jgi:hypothetical protein
VTDEGCLSKTAVTAPRRVNSNKMTSVLFGRVDARLRVIFDNGTESNLLIRSFQKALQQDPAALVQSATPWGVRQHPPLDEEIVGAEVS